MPSEFAAPRSVMVQQPPPIERLPPVTREEPPSRPAPAFQAPQYPPGPPSPPQELKFPKLEHSFESRPPHDPQHGPCVDAAPYNENDFAPTQSYPDKPYDSRQELGAYGDKELLRTQRPWVEWFRPLYDTGPIPRSPEIFGATNVFTPQFLVYGDYRAGAGFIDNGNGSVGKVANRLNLDLDFKLTSTERIHAFVDPFTNGTTFTGVEFGNGDTQFIDGINGNFQTFFFEGDIGAMTGGALGIDPPFDLPFTIGRVPLLFQNGIWMEDAILGAAVAIPARNSPRLDWSNFDITFFAGVDEINSAAFGADDSAAAVFGTHTFIDAYGGYLEMGYAFLDDYRGLGRSYHNIGISFQKRYFNFVSNGLRCIVNAGQDPVVGAPTAQGVLLLCENTFITDNPYFKLPYLNFFAGFDRPQSVARAAGAQGVLRNTGINFESDNLLNYPTLDATANNTWGAAAGLDLLANDLSQQFIVEAAFLQVMGDAASRSAQGGQYALGARYQKPLSNSWIFRADAMYGLRENASDVTGARMELRHKF